MLIVDASTNPPHLLGVDSNRSRQREISGFFVSAVVIDDPTKILPHRNFDRNAWAAEKGQCNGRAIGPTSSRSIDSKGRQVILEECSEPKVVKNC
jgi:hypothetical protein